MSIYKEGARGIDRVPHHVELVYSSIVVVNPTVRKMVDSTTVYPCGVRCVCVYVCVIEPHTTEDGDECAHQT